MTEHKDPVCEMLIEEKDAAGIAEHNGITYYFDSDECMSLFNLDPEKYAGKADRDKFSKAGK